MTASRASSDLRLKPIAPMAATEIDAPATAAMTSIMAATGYSYRLATLPTQKLPSAARFGALAIALAREFGLAGLVLQGASASFAANSH